MAVSSETLLYHVSGSLYSVTIVDGNIMLDPRHALATDMAGWVCDMPSLWQSCPVSTEDRELALHYVNQN